MADHAPPGSKLSTRLAARSGLSRVSMPDGGAVYKGPLARRALRAIGARAMTMDKTIVVDEDFDPTDPEDQALYAHERVHEVESGGDDHPSELHDAEEVAARAVERMVLHRRKSGEDFGSIMRSMGGFSRSVAEGAGRTSASAATPDGGEAGTPSAQSAYKRLLQSGKTHQQIVDMLARRVVRALYEGERTDEIRSGPKKIKTV